MFAAGDVLMMESSLSMMSIGTASGGRSSIL
jgi:hypothetical protein